MKAPLQTKAKTSLSAPPTFTPVRSGLLQRKCACGGTPGATGECEACRKKKLQRRSENLNPSSTIHSPSSLSEVPPIVHEVVRSPGQPLDAGTRAFFEPRFGHDFSKVRVHADAKAAESARSVNALAYTVGSEIAFGAGRYAPEGLTGHKLLAHELAHVVQQRAGVHLKDGIGREGDAYEIQADAVAASMSPRSSKRSRSESASNACLNAALNEPAEPRPSGRGAIQFQKGDLGKPDAEMQPVSTKTIEKEETGPANYAGKKLGPAEAIIVTVTGEEMPKTEDLPAFTEGPRFVLHDTAKRNPDEKAQIEGYKKQERGPLGKTGAAAFIPTVDDPLILSYNFFTSQRVTASAYEKRMDIINLASREIAFQQIWKATNEKAQTKALNDALADFQLTSKNKETAKLTQKEISDQQRSAVEQLTSKLPASPKEPHIFTTAQLAIEQICSKFQAAVKNKDEVAKKTIASDPEALDKGCAALQNFFSLREARLASSVNIEIFQEEGVSGPPLPKPAYTERQYENVTKVYLLAALRAGKFPEITTHYYLDSTAGGDHTDPRCFRLQYLYNLIAGQLGHAKGSLYGVTPKPGTKYGESTIWWNKQVCGKYPSE
jgi:Domain of unknown function (DUF4157)